MNEQASKLVAAAELLLANDRYDFDQEVSYFVQDLNGDEDTTTKQARKMAKGFFKLQLPFKKWQKSLRMTKAEMLEEVVEEIFEQFQDG